MRSQRVVDEVRKYVAANRGGVTTPPPHLAGPLDVAAAYEVQERAFVELNGALEQSIAGYKVSMVAPEHQAMNGTDEPSFGLLAAHQLLAGPVVIELESLHCPLVEPELVFIVREALSLDATPDEIRAKTEVAPGLEIPDSRLEGFFPVPDQTVTDLISDNSFAGLVVHSTEWTSPLEVDLSAVVLEMFVDGLSFGRGVGTNVMGDPVNSVHWLVQRLAMRGCTIPVGAKIASGTFLWPPAAKRATYVGRYEGLGEVSVTFI